MQWYHKLTISPMFSEFLLDYVLLPRFISSFTANLIFLSSLFLSFSLRSVT